MSESISPIDRAWSVVKEDTVNKALPLIPLALLGYGAYQGYKNVRDNQITDPFIGRELAEGDDSFGSNALEFCTGMAQGLGAGAAVKLGAKGVGRLAGRRGAQIASQRAAAREAAETATRNRIAREQADAVSRQLPPVTAANADARLFELARNQPYTRRMAREAGTDAARRGAFRQGAYSQIGRGAKGVDESISLGRMAGLGALGAGAVGLGMAGLNYMQNNTPGGGGGGQGTNLSSLIGGGGSGSTFGLGQTNAGMGDISNVQSSSVLDREIWNPNQGSAFEQQAEYGGTRKSLGEYMFTNNIGEEIKKQVEDMMYKARCAGCAKPECIGKMTCPYGMNEEMSKAKCPGCGKENCVNKMGCTAKGELEMVEHEGKKVPKFAADGKGEEDLNKKEGSKKPAHGMVIVIGSKAGPGPSKNGKREKLDSEKKKD